MDFTRGRDDHAHPCHLCDRRSDCAAPCGVADQIPVNACRASGQSGGQHPTTSSSMASLGAPVRTIWAESRSILRERGSGRLMLTESRGLSGPVRPPRLHDAERQLEHRRILTGERSQIGRGLSIPPSPVLQDKQEG